MLLLPILAFAEDSLTPEPQFKQWTRGFKLKRMDDQKSQIDKCKHWDVVFVGDSITQFFEAGAGRDVWKREFVDGKYKCLNLGISGDRTQNVLWRFDRGFLDGYTAKVFSLMLGPNNSGHREEQFESPADTIAGLKAIVERIRAKHPESKIVLNPIFPCGSNVNSKNRIRNEIVNSEIKKWADGKTVFWLDFNPQFVNADGTLAKAIQFDGMKLHIGKPGYEVWTANLKPLLEEIIEGKAVSPKPENTKVVMANMPFEKDLPQGVVEELRHEDLDSISTNRLSIVYGPCFYDSVVFGTKKAKNLVKKDGEDFLECVFPDAKPGNILWAAKFSGLFDGYFTRTVYLTVGEGPVRDAIVKFVKKRQPQAKIVFDVD